jgi:Domain of unknown function (DUF4160)
VGVQRFFDFSRVAHNYVKIDCQIKLNTMPTISTGRLPRRAQQLVLDWAELHQTALLEDWQLCMNKQQPKPIPPLN